MSLATAAVRNLPTMSATIEQRIFITYAADPDAMRPLVPEKYELRLTNGVAVGGVCLIRLRHMRPSRFPRRIGLTSDNAAHRISILGPDGDPAIWAPRRDTSSGVSAVFGAAMFPNAPGRARFKHGTGEVSLHCSDRAGDTIASIEASPAPSVPCDSIFSSTEEICEYYRSARHGYSPSTTGPDSTIDLEIDGWELEPLHVEAARSAVFSPLIDSGAAVFDHAVRMRNLNSTWRFGAR